MGVHLPEISTLLIAGHSLTEEFFRRGVFSRRYVTSGREFIWSSGTDQPSSRRGAKGVQILHVYNLKTMALWLTSPASAIVTADQALLYGYHGSALFLVQDGANFTIFDDFVSAVGSLLPCSPTCFRLLC